MKRRQKRAVLQLLVQVIQGALVGLGAVLPGISGGVLCVIFGVYTVIMEFLADPLKNLKTHLEILIPFGIGGIIGFWGIASVLSVVLEKYPSQSVCVFIGLIAGMLPTLFKEAGEQGRTPKSYISMVIAAMLVLGLLISLEVFSVKIIPDFGWYLFCGMCLALSVIAPGMSFSTLLMPLGLYEPFVDGIGHFDLGVLIPAGIGTLVTVALFAKGINILFKQYYSNAFHAIVGIVIAATIMMIPIEDFISVEMALTDIFCVLVGSITVLILESFQQKYTGLKEEGKEEML